MVFARHRRIDELEHDVGSNSVDVAIPPGLEGISLGFATPLLDTPLVGTAGGVRLDLVGRAVHDIDPPAIGPPTLQAGRVLLIGVSDAPVIFFLELVLRVTGVGIAPLPEGLNELFPLIISGELLESTSFLVGNDVRDFFIEPLLIGALHFFLHRLAALLFRLVHLLVGVCVLRGRLQNGNGRP